MSPHSSKAMARHAWFIFSILTICYALVSFFRTSTSTLAVDIMREFAVGGGLMSVMSSAYFYPYGFMQIPAGILSDRSGFAQHHRLVPPHRGCGVAPVRPFRLGNGGDGRPRAHRRRHGHGLRARLAGDPVLVPSGTARPRHGLDPFPRYGRYAPRHLSAHAALAGRGLARQYVCGYGGDRACGRRHVAVGTQPPRRGRVRPGMGFHRSPQTPRPALA